MQFVGFFSASTHFWLAEINDVLKRSIVESSGLRNVLHMTTDLCKIEALLQKNQQRTNTKSTRFSTQFKQLQTFHSMWLSLGGHTATSQLFMGLWGLPCSSIQRHSSLLTQGYMCNISMFTLRGTNISPKNGILKMIFLFPRWDMLIPWRVICLIHIPHSHHVELWGFIRMKIWENFPSGMTKNDPAPFL